MKFLVMPSFFDVLCNSCRNDCGNQCVRCGTLGCFGGR